MSSLDDVKTMFSASQLAIDVANVIASKNTALADEESKISDLTSQLTAAQSRLNDLTTIVDSLTSQHSTDQVTMATLNTQINTLSVQITALNAQVADLTAQLAVAQASSLPPPPAPSSAAFSISLQNMVEISTGVYRSTNLGATKASGGQVAVVQARLNKTAQVGQTVTMKYDQTTNVVPDGKRNIKEFRAWCSPSITYPNHWTGCGLGDNGNKITAENVNLAVLQRSSHPTGWTNGYFPFYIKPNVKQHIERTVRISSAIGKGDGYVRIVVDNLLAFESDGFIVDGPVEDFGPQMVYAPNSGDSGPFPVGSYYQVENVSVTVA